MVFEEDLKRLKDALDRAEYVILGAGSGLSASAGFTYSGERFEKYFGDFISKYDFQDMYSAGFYPYDTKEEFWAYWSRYIYINRYLDPPKSTYRDLLSIIKDKNYFVITTNVDHLFQKSGFDKSRLFYTQGDYGLFQCSKPCRNETYDNNETIKEMVDSQCNMRIPTALIPHCPHCGRELTMNLRSDDTFVEDRGWHEHAKLYKEFVESSIDKPTLYLELGVGFNTPSIIKFPFWRMAKANGNSVYASVNLGESYSPSEIKDRSILINGDIHSVIEALME